MSIPRPPDAPHSGNEPTMAGTSLRIHPCREQALLAVAAAQQWDRVDGSAWMQRHDFDAGSLLRLPGLADFMIDAEGRAVEAWPVPGLDSAACRQLYLSNVLPMALSRQRKLVLHASAVAVDGVAVVFVGVSGRGKSTLATSFSHDGHALIVDDGLVVEADGDQVLALPGERSVRLRRDSEQLLEPSVTDAAQMLGYADKRRIPGGGALRFREQSCPIAAVFLLGDDPGASISVRPLPPAQALIELVHYSFLLDVGNAERHAALMRAAARLASACGVCRLDYPRQYALLPQVRRTILEALPAPGRPPAGP